MNKFFVPRTLAEDFDRFLENDIANQVIPFNIYRDWYTQEFYTVKGEIYPDSTKSRYENTDNNMNVRFSLKSGIQKGDIIQDPEGVLYTLDWYQTKESNNIASRALRCNSFLTVKRYTAEVTDDMGYLITPEGYTTIADSIPCNMYRYDGRPEFSASSQTPGVIPNALTLLTVQYNDQTKNIAEGDTFKWGFDEYVIVDVNLVGVDITNSFGTVKIQAKKAAGGTEQ